MTLSNKEAIDLIARILVVKNKPTDTVAAIKELVEATGYDLNPTEPVV